MGQQDNLVDQPVVEQPADQGAAAPHVQLTARLGPQLADGGRDVTGQDGRVRPSRVLSVVEATYLGRVFNASPIGFPGSMPAPQEPAKIAGSSFGTTGLRRRIYRCTHCPHSL